MPFNPFPDIPALPGVPPLLRDLSSNVFPVIQRVLITKDTLINTIEDILGVPKTPQWGLFRDGQPMIVADNVQAVEYRQDWAVANFPIEAGEFASYDKVNSPYTVRIRFSCGGSEEKRRQFMESVDVISDTLDLYDVYTPEKTYSNVNVSHYDWRRDNGVAGLIVVEIWCVEIRTATSVAFADTKTPSGADPTDIGTQQAMEDSELPGRLTAEQIIDLQAPGGDFTPGEGP